MSKGVNLTIMSAFDSSHIDIVIAGPPSEISQQFLQGMVNRMMVSFYKYGPVADAYPNKVNALASLQQRLDKYKKTGNTEFLIDAANFAMIESMYPSLPNAFFKGTDSDQSPGRITKNGEITDVANRNIRETKNNLLDKS